jgi:hypothetical protein
MNDIPDPNPEKLRWHKAFLQALQVELLEYQDCLEFQFERPLASEPLRIDILVIKKKRDVVIELLSAFRHSVENTGILPALSKNILFLYCAHF